MFFNSSLLLYWCFCLLPVWYVAQRVPRGSLWRHFPSYCTASNHYGLFCKSGPHSPDSLCWGRCKGAPRPHFAFSKHTYHRVSLSPPPILLKPDTQVTIHWLSRKWVKHSEGDKWGNAPTSCPGSPSWEKRPELQSSKKLTENYDPLSLSCVYFDNNKNSLYFPYWVLQECTVLARRKLELILAGQSI